MGDFDSSQTRVAPVLARLLMRDPTGVSWLAKLVDLPERFDGTRGDVPEIKTPLRKCAWYPEELKVSPPPALLEWLVRNMPTEARSGKRRALYERDEETLDEALRLLAQRTPSSAERAWYILEGPTSIDGYLETDDAIVVVEGKRTEPAPTTTTTWMPVRHQILRNIDALWDSAGHKPVVAFFIVGHNGTDAVSPEWQEFAHAAVASDALEGSLPHRSTDERQAIANAFLGVTTWRRVCDTFAIDTGSLPDRVPLVSASA